MPDKEYYCMFCNASLFERPDEPQSFRERVCVDCWGQIIAAERPVSVDMEIPLNSDL